MADDAEPEALGRYDPPHRSRGVASPKELVDRSARIERTLGAGGRRRLIGREIRANWLALIMSAAAIALLAFLVGRADGHKGGWLLLLLLGAVAVNAVVFGIARAAKRFAWLGVAVFFSVPLFGGIVSAVRTHRTPKVQPVALIRKSDNVGMCGLYVSEGDKRVYLARVDRHRATNDPAAGSGRIFWVPDADVDMIKIGTLQTLEDADAHAPKLLQELYADRAQDAGTPLKSTSTKTTKTIKGGTVETISEQPAHPPLKPRGKPAPRTTPNTCTGVYLDGDPERPDPLTPPRDDSPPDP